jgi:hypothetical protein
LAFYQIIDSEHHNAIVCRRIGQDTRTATKSGNELVGPKDLPVLIAIRLIGAHCLHMLQWQDCFVTIMWIACKNGCASVHTEPSLLVLDIHGVCHSPLCRAWTLAILVLTRQIHANDDLLSSMFGEHKVIIPPDAQGTSMCITISLFDGASKTCRIVSYFSRKPPFCVSLSLCAGNGASSSVLVEAKASRTTKAWLSTPFGKVRAVSTPWDLEQVFLPKT